MQAAWQVQLLGTLALRSPADPGRIVSRFYSRRAGLLLAYLAYYRQQAHPRERLVGLLWPEAEEPAGRLRLRVALSALRRQLEPPGTAAGTVLAADRATVRLQPEAVTTDVAAFEAALRQAN